MGLPFLLIVVISFQIVAYLLNIEIPPAGIESKPDERVKWGKCEILSVGTELLHTLRGIFSNTGFDYISSDHQVSDNKFFLLLCVFEEDLRNRRTDNSRKFPEAFGNC